MDTTLEHYVEGQDFGTLRVQLGPDDDCAIHATGTRAATYLDLPLYAHQARELIEVLTPLANEPDQ